MTDRNALAPCPFCKKPMMLRAALWPTEGDRDAIIHADSTDCPMASFADDTFDESIVDRWNAALRQSPTDNSPRAPSGWRDMATAWKLRAVLGIDASKTQFVMRWRPQEQPHHDKEGWFEQIYRRVPVAWMPLPDAALTAPDHRGADDVPTSQTIGDESFERGRRDFARSAPDQSGPDDMPVAEPAWLKRIRDSLSGKGDDEQFAGADPVEDMRKLLAAYDARSVAETKK